MSRRPLGRWMFGKLPVLGDFVSRGLEFPLRDALDHWLSAEMHGAHQRFGDAFDDLYFAAPAWCFVDCDPDGQWSGGALCASVDAAGRKFPVMAAAPADDLAAARLLAGGCLDALHGAFAEGCDADGLQASTIPPTELPWQPSGCSWALVGEDGPAMTLPGRFPQGILTVMMELAA